jgi:hypothetical protein
MAPKRDDSLWSTIGAPIGSRGASFGKSEKKTGSVPILSPRSSIPRKTLEHGGQIDYDKRREEERGPGNVMVNSDAL